MRRETEIVIWLMLAIGVTIGCIIGVYANTGGTRTDTVYTAIINEDQPIQWFNPEDLGITKIIDYGAEKPQTIHVVVPLERDPGNLTSWNPIFKYKDRFYQIISGHVDFFEGPDPKRSMRLLPAIGLWTVVVVRCHQLYKKKTLKNTVTAGLVVLLSITPICISTPTALALESETSEILEIPPETPATEESLVDLGLPENITYKKILPLPETKIGALDATGEVDDSEGDNPLYVLVFGDEEARGTFYVSIDLPCSWDYYAKLQIERGDNVLVKNFGIDIRILDFLEWDSD
ncbi:MAG: hypothetical protein KIH10_18190, partial [Candidatus Freyarchaeota archaeon]|nr:hypothetical protein [Candidatus Jordarchaeia archaeon]